MQRISRLAELSWAERWRLCEAAFELTMARVVLAVLPFRWLSAWLRRAQRRLADPEQPEQLIAVSRAIDIAGRHVPMHISCLARTLAARRMLRRRGIGSTMHLGVTRTADKGMHAHAWLQVGGMVVCGGDDETLPFTTVALFSDEVPRE